MKDTVQINISTGDEQVREQLIAQLSTIDFEGFEERDSELVAFINLDHFNAADLEEIMERYKVSYTQTIIPEQNWNAVWESSFAPVIVDDFCAIRADFHPSSTAHQHEIIITPKMSFGTGHHATTYLMIKEMSTIDFKNRAVADFGTGTGILAILAEKLGSDSVWAIDVDQWSMENAKENIERNNCKNIILEKKEGFETSGQFDVILANINKNVILENEKRLAHAVKRSTHLLLSGLLKEDEREVVSGFNSMGFTHIRTTEKNNWICILLKYQLKSQ